VRKNSKNNNYHLSQSNLPKMRTKDKIKIQEKQDFGKRLHPDPMSNRKKCLLYGRNKKNFASSTTGSSQFPFIIPLPSFYFPQKMSGSFRREREEQTAIAFFFAVG
jgi:hypothetical protein